MRERQFEAPRPRLDRTHAGNVTGAVRSHIVEIPAAHLRLFARALPFNWSRISCCC